MFAVGITTFNRNLRGSGKNYFFDTWQSLLMGGLFSSGIVKDIYISVGHGPDNFTETVKRTITGARIDLADHPLNVVANTHKVFEWFLTTNNQFLIFFQDDVLVCPNTFQEIDRWINKKKIALYTIAAPFNDFEGFTTDTWNYPYRKFYMLAAVILPKQLVQGYLNSRHKTAIELRRKCVDLAVKNYCQEAQIPILAHCPNIATHVGENSCHGNIHPPGSRGTCNLKQSALRGPNEFRKPKSLWGGVSIGSPQMGFRGTRVRSQKTRVNRG